MLCVARRARIRRAAEAAAAAERAVAGAIVSAVHERGGGGAEYSEEQSQRPRGEKARFQATCWNPVIVLHST